MGWLDKGFCRAAINFFFFFFFFNIPQNYVRVFLQLADIALQTSSTQDHFIYNYFLVLDIL